MATTFTRLAGLARVFRARVAALFTLDARFLAELFLEALFFDAPRLVALFLEALFFEAPRLVALFLPALFLALVVLEARFFAALFLVDPPFFRAVAVLRLRELVPRALPLLLFFAAVLLFRALVERFLVEAPLFAVERELLVLLRRVLFFAPARPADFRPADFDLELPRDDFLVVAIHELLVSR